MTAGLCCQIMHKGPYDDEPETIKRLEQFIAENGYACDISKLDGIMKSIWGTPEKQNRNG